MRPTGVNPGESELTGRDGLLRSNHLQFFHDSKVFLDVLFQGLLSVDAVKRWSFCHTHLVREAAKTESSAYISFCTDERSL